MAHLAICIGAQKAGTSWLFRCLQEHPAICATPGKELHFFSDRYDGTPSGLHSYEECFSTCADRPIWFEASTSYLSSEAVPERIAKHYPDARLIAILRDPVDRAFSHYLHLRSKEPQYTATFLEALAEKPQLVTNGKYGSHLARYRQHFDPQQILVIDYRDLERTPQAVIDAVCTHLGIDSITPSTLRKRYHSAEARSNRLYFKINKYLKKLRRTALGRSLLSGARRMGLSHVTFDTLMKKTGKKQAQLTAAERAEAATYFADDQAAIRLIQAYFSSPGFSRSDG